MKNLEANLATFFTEALTLPEVYNAHVVELDTLFDKLNDFVEEAWGMDEEFDVADYFEGDKPESATDSFIKDYIYNDIVSLLEHDCMIDIDLLTEYLKEENILTEED